MRSFKMVMLVGILFLVAVGSYAAEKNQVVAAPVSPSISEAKIVPLVPVSYNWIKNGSFESALNGTNPDGWSVSSGTANLGIDNSEKRVGSSSLLIENALGLIVSQQINDLNGLKEGKISFGAWVKSIIPGQVQLLVDYAGTQYTSEFNTGIGDWEFLKVEVPVEIEINQLNVGIAVNSKESVAIDGAVLYPAARNLVFTPNPADDIKMPSGLIYTDLQNKTVGIGTTTPQELLDVAGNVNVSGSGKVAGDLEVAGNLIVDGQISTKESLMAESIVDPAGTNLLGLGAWDQNDTSVYLKNSSKNVGIGTANPETKLDVRGNLTLSSGGISEIETIYKGPRWYHIGTKDNGGRFSVYEENLESKGFHLMGSSGNVGIGTTIPNAKVTLANSNNPDLTFVASGIHPSQPVGRIYGGYDSVNWSDDYLRFQSTDIDTTGGVLVDTMTLKNGNVGIGTTAPGRVLDISATPMEIITRRADAAVDNRAWRWANTGMNLQLEAMNDALTTGTNVMTLTRSGNVGIGTTSPGTLLDLGNAGGRKLSIYRDAATNVQAGFGIDLSGSVREHSIYFPSGSGGHIAFGSMSEDGNNTFSEKMRIDTSGNVGIGMTNPLQKLQVAGIISSYAPGVDGQLWASRGNDALTTVLLHSNGASYLNGGAVGIGTTSPIQKLTVDVGESTDGIIIRGSDYPRLMLGNYPSGSWAYMYYNNYSGVLSLGTLSNSEAISIKSSGVGIKKDNPAYTLDVNGDVNGNRLCIGTDCRTAWPDSGGGVENVWSQSGSDIYYSSGNVGIGTTPQSGYKLNVSGITKMSTGTAGYTLEVTNTSNYPTASAISGYGHDTIGVQGQSYSSHGVHAESASGYGIFATSASNYAGYFAGNVNTTGTTYTGELEITGGADIAEPFEVLSDKIVELGSVVIIDSKNSGKLTLSNREYDKRVAGVVSGAGGIRSGLKLRQKESLDKGIDVALTGRVYVRANTSNGTIEPGDLLTTSSIAGEAMKATDHQASQGSVLGKAMSELKEGEGLVLILVNLQ